MNIKIQEKKHFKYSKTKARAETRKTSKQLAKQPVHLSKLSQ